MSKVLKNKPLLEAIFEVQWQLKEANAVVRSDPYYKLLIGRFFDRIKSDYPYYEQLPSAAIPDELVGYVVQHRFRIAENKWPLVQIGPGIMSVNSTIDYTWDDFRPRILFALKELIGSHPKIDEFQIKRLSLRYIDSVDFDYVSNDVHDFLRQFMKVDVKLPDSLFSGTDVNSRPCSTLHHFSYQSNNPQGRIHLRFNTNTRDGNPVLLWETNIESIGDDLPKSQDEYVIWLDRAHCLTDDWFFKVIDGDLERRFSGE